MRPVELLIPASSLEVLKTAVILWSGCRLYRRRSIWTSCKSKELFDGRYGRGHCQFAHEHGVKVYVTANILAHNR